MSLDNLPVEWIISNVGQVLNNTNNLRKPVSSKEREKIKGDYPYYGATGKIDALNSYTHDGEYILMGEDGANLLSRVKNQAFVVKGKFWVNNHAHSLQASCEMPSNFFAYYLNQIDLRPFITGSAQPKLTRQNLDAIPMVVVPLAEQQEIVRQLDVMLAQVEQIKARLDAIPAILKKFRQSVLADAVSGKLTEDWRNSRDKILDLDFENFITEYRSQKYLEWEKESLVRKGKTIPTDENLLKKYKPVLSLYDRSGLPNGWSRQLLEGLIYISARIGWKGLKAEEYTQEGPLFLSVHGLNYGKVVRLDQAFHISQERYDESPEIALENNDILLCKDGAGIGKVGIVKGLREPASINSSLLLIRSGEIFIPEFLYYVFKGPYIQKLVRERLTGTAIPHLFQRDIKEFLLDIPPLDEQKIIVESVEHYFELIEKIEKTVQSAQKRVNLLTQSILAKAFSGELTAEWREQHQELITGINSAEALLAKIQAEREASKPVKKTGKKLGA